MERDTRLLWWLVSITGRLRRERNSEEITLFGWTNIQVMGETA